MLSPGNRVWVRVPCTGFVGVGRVTGHAQPAATFRVTTAAGDTPVLEATRRGTYHREFLEDPERCEYFVPVRWLQTVPLEGRCMRSVFSVIRIPFANQRRQSGDRPWSA